MRLRHDALASSQGVGRNGRVGTAASEALGPSRRSGPDRLGESLLRLGECGRSRGQRTGPNPTDKGKKGSKRHLMVDRSGAPLSVTHSVLGRCRASCKTS